MEMNHARPENQDDCSVPQGAGEDGVGLGLDLSVMRNERMVASECEKQTNNKLT